MECFACCRVIPAGEPYVSVDYHIERDGGTGDITVEQAESLLTVCQDCAPSKDAIAEALRSAGFPVPPAG
jgi:hypothetical protein